MAGHKTALLLLQTFLKAEKFLKFQFKLRNAIPTFWFAIVTQNKEADNLCMKVLVEHPFLHSCYGLFFVLHFRQMPYTSR